ncbi:MAG TPA: alpha/beta hydrolase [Bryobacteraceae bacterium]|jgi:pimeloyl-ACP methyl ester carboxylesterase
MRIVFIHGLFRAILDPPEGWWCPALPGYSESQLSPATLPDAVEFIASNCDGKLHIVGHSIGGAIAVMLASRYPARVASVINIEGNFTLKDAFWSSRLAQMSAEEADAELAGFRADPSAWLTNTGVPPTPQSIAIARWSLATPARTIQSMARSVVEITSQPDYLEQVRQILDRGIPFHLIAGEHSRAGWDVPDFVLARAASFQIEPNAGHMLMLNDQAAFTALVEKAAGK